MITDARVFQTEFVPSDVVHRDAEINHLSSVLRPITNDEPVEPAFLYGPSGTGKTCIAQYTVEKLREEVISVNYQYVNCWEDHSRYKALYRILEGVDATLDIHRQSTPTDVLMDRILNYEGPRYIVILDEVDQLENKDVLYELVRAPLELVMISNEERELFAELGERLTSRLRTCVSISFDNYSDTQLVSILEDRVRWGLQPDMIDDEQLWRIADAAAGDARIAIGVLRVAARAASRRGADRIDDDVITEAVSEAKSEVQQKNIEKLTEDQRLLYEIITEHGDIAPGNLYEAYQSRADNPKTKRMVRNYLQKMEHYNLVKAIGQNRGRQYHVVT